VSARFSRLADWLSWQETLHPRAIDLGLERLVRTLTRLGWQRSTCPVITIGGTNGKGSSVALCTQILREAGLRVGSFTSPHVLRYQERITIDGVEVADESLMVAFERIDAARGDETLTFFEFNTLAALLVFETAHLDAIVLEVGLGGRLDAVNVVDGDVSLVTSIGLDHCDWLGRDVESIGREKAGIFRHDRPAIFGARDMPTSIATVASHVGADLHRLGRDFDWSRDGDRHWSWRGRRGHHEHLPSPALFGLAQYDNAASVLAVLEALSGRLEIGRAAIERGLSRVRLPGRFQRFPGRVEWILDVAHNPAAATVLAAQLAATPARGRTVAVCGILGDKDIEGILAAVRDVIDVWIVAGVSGPRAIESTELARRFRASGAEVVEHAPTVVAACEAGARLAREEDRVVVFGSFLTVGPALEWLEHERSLSVARS
jgi:dihydrofolate synthase/folylpolyglutamate synthase